MNIQCQNKEDLKHVAQLPVFRYIIVIFLLYIYFNSVYFRFLGPLVSQHILIPAVLICLSSKMFLFIKQNKKLLWLYLILFFVTALITIIGEGDRRPFMNSILKIVYYMYIPSIIIPYMYTYRLSLSKCVIAIGWISGVISTLCFISGGFASVMSELFMNFVEDTDRITEGRGFGIASGITYAYGLVNAFILAYSLSINYHKRWYSIFFYILLLFATIINTRTSFILELLFVIVFFFMSGSKNKAKIALLGVLIGALIYYYVLPRIMGSTTGDWLMQGFYMINDYMYDTSTARNYNVFYILQNMIIFPETMSEWMFGTGKFIYQKSDIGFILQLYYGGLIYLGLLLITYYVTIKNIDNMYMKVCAIIMLIIANYKGVYLEYTDGLKFITFIAMYEVFFNYQIRQRKLLIAKKYEAK